MKPCSDMLQNLYSCLLRVRVFTRPVRFAACGDIHSFSILAVDTIQHSVSFCSLRELS